jgi:hypothetical protein
MEGTERKKEDMMMKTAMMPVVLVALVSGASAVDRPAEGMAVLDHLEALPVFHAPGTKTIHFGNYDRLEQQVDPKDLVATGRAYKGESSFVMKIQPDNAGVRLRKRISRLLGDGNVQLLDVYVDGEKLESPWLICELRAREHIGTETLKALWGKNDFTLCEFADVEYEIPARYTKGKKKLGIRLVYREPTGTDLAASKEYLGVNEYHYWAFTY